MSEEMIIKLNEEQEKINKLAEDFGLIPTWNEDEQEWEYLGEDKDRREFEKALEYNNLA